MPYFAKLIDKNCRAVHVFKWIENMALRVVTYESLAYPYYF